MFWAALVAVVLSGGAPGDAAAGTNLLRPDSVISSTWSTVGAPHAAGALDDNVTSGQQVAQQDYIHPEASGQVAHVNLANPALGAGEAPHSTTAYYFAKTGRKSRLRVQITRGSEVLAERTVKPKAGARWRQITAPPPDAAAANQLSLRFEAVNRAAAQVRAAYVHLDSTACTFGQFAANSPPGDCWRPYASSSPFNRTLPAAPRQAAGSTAIANRLDGFGPGPQIIAGTSGTGADYDHPIYYSRPSDPSYKVRCVQPGACEVDGQRLRIPGAAKPAGGADGHLAVIDQQAGWEYDFYNVRRKPRRGGKLRVSWGGKTPIGTGVGNGLGSNATAAHFALAAGVIRPAELRAGLIDHALVIAVECTNGRSVYPADSGTGRSCSQIGKSNSNAPPLGSHFYLQMSDAEINALAAPEWRKTILRAMARYGMFVEDTGAEANGWAVLVESGASFTSFGQPDPWVMLGQELGVQSFHRGGVGRVYNFDLQNVVDWGSKLRVADPCVSAGTC
jgi:hypothetical protein